MKAVLTNLTCPECQHTLYMYRKMVGKGDDYRYKMWLECGTRDCPEYGKQYAVPTVNLTPLKRKEKLENTF